MGSGVVDYKEPAFAENSSYFGPPCQILRALRIEKDDIKTRILTAPKGRSGLAMNLLDETRKA
jgi:hypothetical protein